MAKKIKIEIECEEFWVADSLRELAGYIENSDLTYAQLAKNEMQGDHFVAKLTISK